MKHKRTSTDLAAPASSLVLPEQLAQHAADAVRELLAEAAAANTTRSYAAALRYWAGCANALKGTPGATITWKAWEEGNQFKLSISDNGPGMSDEQVKNFEENLTIGSSKHGLGLNLVKDMAQSIGCTITLISKKEAGTTFILTFGS